MAYDANFDSFLRVAQTIVNDNVRALNGDDTSMDVIEIAISQLNALWRNVGRMNTLYPQCDGLLENLQSLIRCIENMKRRTGKPSIFNYGLKGLDSATIDSVEDANCKEIISRIQDADNPEYLMEDESVNNVLETDGH
ncbi:Hypothetical predicted protein [Mytilus galloprovincialis]|uniref:Uncharacterized protein n=1 Tax=Mytilus galloprovincialis TaxID=29158 RepID=A0A8B6DHQ7_MYTGA|nr:Hypothetical predicted protein [Mytilus galloprovincialis]